MKHVALLFCALMGLLAQAAIPEYAGGVAGSLEDVKCSSIVNGHAEDYTSVQDRRRDHDGYVQGMVIRGIWYDEKGAHHFADFTVVVANWDVETSALQVIGVSEKRNSLELKVDTSNGLATMYINGKAQNISHFTCETPIAG